MMPPASWRCIRFYKAGRFKGRQSLCDHNQKGNVAQWQACRHSANALALGSIRRVLTWQPEWTRHDGEPAITDADKDERPDVAHRASRLSNLRMLVEDIDPLAAEVKDMMVGSTFEKTKTT
jgi:hypothetical protein